MSQRSHRWLTLLDDAKGVYRTTGKFEPLAITGAGFFFRPSAPIQSGQKFVVACIQDAPEEIENVKNGLMPDSDRARNPDRPYRTQVFDRSGNLLAKEGKGTQVSDEVKVADNAEGSDENEPELVKSGSKGESAKHGAEFGEAEQVIANALSDETSIHFERIPLHKVIKAISDAHEIPIVVNTQELKKRGITVNVPLTFDVEKISLRSALRLLMKKHELTFLIKDEVLQITTVKHARSIALTRVYPVDDISVSGEDIAKQLQQSLDAAWKKDDAKPVVAHLSGKDDQSGKLSVQANDSMQRNVSQQLHQLRNKKQGDNE